MLHRGAAADQMAMQFAQLLLLRFLIFFFPGAVASTSTEASQSAAASA